MLAEALALKERLELAWRKGYMKLYCEVDCQELIVTLGNIGNFNFFPVARDIDQLLKRNWEVNIFHVGRECNSSTDCIAKWGTSLLVPGLKIIDVPYSDLETFVLRDALWFS